MIKNIDQSSSVELIPLLVDLGYPDQDLQNLKIRIENFLSNSNSWIYGYRNNDELVGFATLSFIPFIHEDGYLARVSALAVKQSHQGKGVGKQLMNHIESFCKTKACSRIELTSGAKRELTAHPFYPKIGYKKSDGARFVKAL